MSDTVTIPKQVMLSYFCPLNVIMTVLRQQQDILCLSLLHYLALDLSLGVLEAVRVVCNEYAYFA